jgi:heat shock protein HtpX
MRGKHPSLLWRAVLALVLMVSFYLLALAVAGGLLYVPYAEIRFTHRIHPKLALMCIVAACAILWSILPRIDKFRAPGAFLDAPRHPRLFQELDATAAAVGQAMPAEVYLVPDVNAWVSHCGGVMGFGSRRVMGLGLPLLRVLTVSQLRAVLAHEFGHYHGGDTALAPWIYKTRAAIIRTVEHLGDSFIQKPFVWYAKMFLRITNAVSRQQEYAADALAARVVGAAPLITGLQTVSRAGQAFEAYWDMEVAPLLSAGYRPPLADGFAAFFQSSRISSQTAAALSREMEEAHQDPYDTHPCLKDRIAALSGIPSNEGPTNDSAAISLLDDVAVLERHMLRTLAGKDDPGELRAIQWQDALSTVYMPAWLRTVREHVEALSRICLGQLPDLAKAPETLIARFDLPEAASGEEQWYAVRQVVGAAVALALYGRGCHTSCELGEPIQIRVGTELVNPFALLSDLASGAMPADRWEALCRSEGLNDLNLRSAVDRASSVGLGAAAVAIHH